MPRSVKDPVTSNRANIDATLNVLVAARDAGVKRLVYAGSSSAYGNPPTLPKREDMRAAPLSPYALQKLVGEQYCQMFTRLYGLETVTTRYFNVFGPRQDPGSPYSGVISLFSTALASDACADDLRRRRADARLHVCRERRRRRAARVRGAGRGRRGHQRRDAAAAISLLELVRVLQTVLGTDVAPTFEPGREGDVHDSQADIAKARRLLGYEPSVPFDEGIRRTVAWVRATEHVAR